MATLQVKRLPDELYAAVKERAADEGISLSELVTRVLRAEVSRPSMRQWLESVPAREAPVRVDIGRVMDDVRDDAPAR